LLLELPIAAAPTAPSLAFRRFGTDTCSWDAMSYVDRVLQPGEILRYRGTVHWVTYLPAMALFLIAAAGAVFAGTDPRDRVAGLALAGLGLGLGILSFLPAWFRRATTEIAVTDRRVIFKRGFIARRSFEMHMDKVESVDVIQGVLGRILDYGDVIIHGTGADQEPLRRVQSPLTLRNAITAR
jgi:uncharacterized membrane protein YdbT with pleckstrin-like domain